MKSTTRTVHSFGMTCLAVILTGALAGCGGSSDLPDLVPVSGTVTLDGKPLEGASVFFELQDDVEGKKSSFGQTDSSGKYELTFGGGTGARPGKHLVKISKQESAGGDAEGSGASEVKQLVPEKYNNKSELTVEVSADSAEHNFDLKSN